MTVKDEPQPGVPTCSLCERLGPPVGFRPNWRERYRNDDVRRLMAAGRQTWAENRRQLEQLCDGHRKATETLTATIVEAQSSGI
jgi:hypothetical protein